MKRIIFIAVCAVFVFCGLARPGFAKENGCVACHTDDAAIKSLFNPPAMPAQEGEG